MYWISTCKNVTFFKASVLTRKPLLCSCNCRIFGKCFYCVFGKYVQATSVFPLKIIREIQATSENVRMNIFTLLDFN